jgi:hypothetical protein
MRGHCELKMEPLLSYPRARKVQRPLLIHTLPGLRKCVRKFFSLSFTTRYKTF